MNREMEALQKEFCPPLDEALVFALAFDYDLEKAEEVVEFRKALDTLRHDAVREQELELLPPTTEPLRDHLPDGAANGNPSKRSATSHHSHSATLSTSDEDAIASISTGLTEIALSDGAEASHEHDAWWFGAAGDAFEDLSEEQKVQWLSSMFPSVQGETVRTILARSQGRFGQSTDELLNISFIEENGIGDETDAPTPPIGIEGFATDDIESRARRKGRGKNRRHRNRADHAGNASSPGPDNASVSAAPHTNIWVAAPADIEFIASRTHLKAKTITSAYHANGARLPPTIRALILQEGQRSAHGSQGDEDILQWQLEELQTYFPQTTTSLVHGALTLAGFRPSAAKELLETMLQSNEQPVVLGKLEGVASYTPLNLSDTEHDGPRYRPDMNRATIAPGSSNIASPLTNNHGTAASRAFEQASAAYKRGKSDRLMGGAAAYYATLGHEHIKAAKSLQTIEADAHVASQSSSNTLDLHGVTVSQAVRIANEKTRDWWESLGDRKYVPVGGVGDGYKIITGVGRHSSDGVGRIGPAVSKMLVREGWKVQVGTGEITVWGRARTR